MDVELWSAKCGLKFPKCYACHNYEVNLNNILPIRLKASFFEKKPYEFICSNWAGHIKISDYKV